MLLRANAAFAVAFCLTATACETAPLEQSQALCGLPGCFGEATSDVFPDHEALEPCDEAMFAAATDEWYRATLMGINGSADEIPLLDGMGDNAYGCDSEDEISDKSDACSEEAADASVDASSDELDASIAPSSDEWVPYNHNTGRCYGACSAACGGCCQNYSVFCAPRAQIIAGGWNALGPRPNLCAEAGVPQDGLPAGFNKRVRCGRTVVGYVSRPAGPGVNGRRWYQSGNSPGSCPEADWAAARPRWTRGDGTAFDWSDTGTQLKACSTHSACWRHDECNRHDASLRYAECQVWGVANAGTQASAGTPSVNFAAGWWRADGSAPLVGNRNNGLGSRAPARDCYYLVGAALDSVVLDGARMRATDFPASAHAAVQATCPIHGRRHR